MKKQQHDFFLNVSISTSENPSKSTESVVDKEGKRFFWLFVF